jgi:hypothetical protein
VGADFLAGSAWEDPPALHYVGFNWPNHIFVNQDFKVIAANQSIS